MQIELLIAFRYIKGFVKPLREIIYQYAKNQKLKLTIKTTTNTHDGYCSAPEANTPIETEDTDYINVPINLNVSPSGTVEIDDLKEMTMMNVYGDDEYIFRDYTFSGYCNCDLSSRTCEIVDAELVDADDNIVSNTNFYPQKWSYKS